MKKITLIFLIIIFNVINFSCSNKNENDDTNKLILGKWKLIDRQIGNNIGNLNNCPEPETITFFENNTLENYFIIGDNCVFSSSTYNYLIEDNVLIQNQYVNLDPIGYTFINKATIDILNETTLVLKYFYTSEEGEFPEWAIITETFKKNN